ncbi:DHA1 family multidrug resistance protein B-like MFS transporter [Weissella uvarum]|uniref:MDR family MFS transporter n=1 Tax=Weissella uvarum TaxID=1479233 RepID=UPI001961E4AF|nr:MFS transporter [Weissella uvarum]MBM7616873.1 DHA1 family multidrug resistance protein B-like MFS transporter [Weissella uvarum]MCM0594675.1 MFS transporter [Weissella uvarum]
MREFMDLDRNLKLRALTVFLTVLVGSSVGPNMTIYYVQHFGSFWTGILLMVVSIAGLIFGLYGGHISDVIGRKRTIEYGQIAMFIGYGLAMANNLPHYVNPYLTFVGFLLAMVGSSLADPAEQAMMIDSSTPKNRRFVFALIYWILNIGVMLGAAIGGWFFRDYLFELLIFMTIVPIINYAIVRFGMSETLDRAAHMEQTTSIVSALKGYWEVLKDHRYLTFALASVLASIVYLQPDYYLAAHLSQSFHSYTLFGADIYGQRMLSIMLILNTIMIVLVMGWVTRRTEKWRLVPAFAIGVLLQGGGFAASFLLQDFWPLIVMTIIFTTGEMIGVPASQTLRADMMDPDRIGAYSGVFSVTKPIGAVFASGFVSLSAIVNNIGIAMLLMVIVFASIILVARAAAMPAPFDNEKTANHES